MTATMTNMEESGSEKPVVLLLGEIEHAHSQWEALSDVAELQVTMEGDREQFIADCQSGRYDRVRVISRTFNSVKVTGLIDAELVSHLPPQLRYICHNGAGYDQVDALACARKGIAVSNTPGVVDNSTADTALFLLLGALRRCWAQQSSLRNGGWRGKDLLGHDPEGMILGILGLGGIGTAFAQRAQTLGMRLQYHNRHALPDERNPTGAKYIATQEELLRTSDVLSVHLPLNSHTHHILDRAAFAQMKPGAILINTARGPIIDEEALIEALDSGRLFSAGLDVYEDEPRVPMGLLKHDKIELLPHVGTQTYETQTKMEVLVMDNIRSALQHGQLLTPVPEWTQHQTQSREGR